jgi:hypothetical protein
VKIQGREIFGATATKMFLTEYPSVSALSNMSAFEGAIFVVRRRAVLNALCEGWIVNTWNNSDTECDGTSWDLEQNQQILTCDSKTF